MKVYFISGLAADSRVFKNIQLPDGHEIIHLEWITALENETLSDYAIRLGSKIDRSQPFSVIGLSMGGMMASEISRHYKPEHTVLISSVPSSRQLPVYFSVFYKLRLHKLVPVSTIKSLAIAKRLFTTETSEDKEVLFQIIKDSDPVFIKWAMEAVLKWNALQIPESYVHIHGTRDEVLPMRFTKPTHIIKGAGHLMVMNRAQEINQIISDVLSPVTA